MLLPSYIINYKIYNCCFYCCDSIFDPDDFYINILKSIWPLFKDILFLENSAVLLHKLKAGAIGMLEDHRDLKIRTLISTFALPPFGVAHVLLAFHVVEDENLQRKRFASLDCIRQVEANEEWTENFELQKTKIIMQIKSLQQRAHFCVCRRHTKTVFLVDCKRRRDPRRDRVGHLKVLITKRIYKTFKYRRFERDFATCAKNKCA